MISRRRFLEAGGVAAGVAAVPHPLLAFGAATDEKSGDSCPAAVPGALEVAEERSHSHYAARNGKNARSTPAS